MPSRKPVTSAPYAFKSATADNAITLAGLEASTYDQSTEVTAAQVQADGNSTRIDSIEATDADITAVVAGAGLAGGATNGSATISLATNGVQAANMSFNSVSGGAIQANAVATNKIADGAVTSTKILDSTILPSDMDTSSLFTNLDADLLDGQQASEIIEAASDEVRTPISSVPFTITESGSYYFTKNLNHTDSASNAIQINASNVTIDLMGFTLTGPGKNSGASNSGIEMIAQSNNHILNGTIKEFGGRGVVEQNFSGRAHQIRNLKVINNGFGGIVLGSSFNEIRDCIVLQNGLSVSDKGIFTQEHSVILNNVANDNSGDGISANSNSTVIGNAASRNGRAGILAGSSNIKNNVANGNTLWGMLLGSKNLVQNNVIRGNNISNNVDGGGLRIFSDNKVVNNQVSTNGQQGINIDSSDNIIDNNHVTDSSTCISFDVSGNAYRNNTAAGCTTIAFGGAQIGATVNLGGNVGF